MIDVLLYHRLSDSDCPDGVCALWAANKGLKSQKNMFFGVIHKNNDFYLSPNFVLPFDLNKDFDVYLLDFCYPKKILSRILDGCNSLTVLDHHDEKKENIAYFSDRILGGIKDRECGASCTWKYFFPREPLPWFMRHVRLRDTGQAGYYDKKQPNSEAICAVISQRCKGKMGAEAFPVFDRLLVENESDLIREGCLLIEKRELIIPTEVECWDGTLIQLGEHKVPFIKIKNPDCFEYISEVGSRAARCYDQFSFVAVVAGDETKISL